MKRNERNGKMPMYRPIFELSLMPNIALGISYDMYPVEREPQIRIDFLCLCFRCVFRWENRTQWFGFRDHMTGLFK
jgi:hypothetical protein